MFRWPCEIGLQEWVFCICLTVLVYASTLSSWYIWTFFENHIFKRWIAVKNIHRSPGTCGPDPPHSEKSSPKSQALTCVNYILCKTVPLAVGSTLNLSFWLYKENSGGIQAGLVKVGPTQTFLAYYQHTAFCTWPTSPLTSRPIPHMFPIFPWSK